MSNHSDVPLDKLWREYGEVFEGFDDLMLARWMAQTLGQLQGRVWRSSHPLVGAYRLAAQVANDRQIWHKRLATAPRDYSEASCCRAPLLPLLTRDVPEQGLLCQHCNATAIPFDDIPVDLQKMLRNWAEKYATFHQVAHWDDRQQKRSANYERALEDAAFEAEKLLAAAGNKIGPALLEFYPAVLWEDQDECLDVRPEDIPL